MSATDLPASPNRLLTAKEVAERWQVSKGQIYTLARAGKIPTVVIGHSYRFRLEALIEWEQRGGARGSSAGGGVDT